MQFSSGGLGSSWTITDCWQISFPCDCMSEVLIFMLAVGQRLFLVPRDRLQVFSMGPIDSLQYGNLLSPNNQGSLHDSFLLKCHPIKPVPPRIISLLVNSK